MGYNCSKLKTIPTYYFHNMITKHYYVAIDLTSVKIIGKYAASGVNYAPKKFYNSGHRCTSNTKTNLTVSRKSIMDLIFIKTNQHYTNVLKTVVLNLLTLKANNTHNSQMVLLSSSVCH